MKGPVYGHLYRSHLRGKLVAHFIEEPGRGESG